MPVPSARDPETTRAGLRSWFTRLRPAASDVEVALLPSPRATGYSSETILFEIVWSEKGEARRGEYAARVEPSGYTLFQDHDLDAQRRILEALHRYTDVPVPRVVGHADRGDSPLGQPFFVTERVHGIVPPDWPSYARSGWLLEATPEQQRTLYESGLGILAALRAADWSAMGLEFLVDPGRRPVGLEAELGHDRGFLAWVAEGRALPLFEGALDWLARHCPADDRRHLNWGDARPGNIIFRDFHPVAVLDWEMATVGPPEADLGWWIVFQRMHTEGHGLPPLPGFPSPDEAVALYEAMTGEPVQNLAFFEVRAALRAALLLFRFNDMLLKTGKITPDSPNAPQLPATRVLEALLAEPTEPEEEP